MLDVYQNCIDYIGKILNSNTGDLQILVFVLFV